MSRVTKTVKRAAAQRIAFLEDQLREVRGQYDVAEAKYQGAVSRNRELHAQLSATPKPPRVSIIVNGGTVTFNGTAQAGQS